MGNKEEVENNTHIFGACGHEKERMDYHEHMDFWTESQSRGLWELILDGHNAYANVAATKEHALFRTCPGIQELAFLFSLHIPSFFFFDSNVQFFLLGISKSFYHTLLFGRISCWKIKLQILFRVDGGSEVRVVPLTSAFRTNDDIAGRPRNVTSLCSGYHVFDICSR